MLCAKTKYVVLSFFVVQCFIFQSFSQELPPIEHFTAKDYGADNQNWGISQALDETIYIANNKGLLEYNGARWHLYANKDQTVVRSVLVADEKIYTGSYMDFGFWERDSFGKLQYTSLVKRNNLDLIQDEEFWSIISLDDWLLFQSLDRIYIYNAKTEQTRIIDSDYRIPKMFKVGDRVYFQKLNDGIYKIENGKAILVTNSSVIKDQEVINIFQEGNDILIHTRNEGLFIFQNNTVSKWQIEANALLSTVSAYSSVRLRNGNFIIGTISDGLIKIDSRGNLLFTMNQNSGLSNNTVLSVFQDVSGNIWLALDNGVNVLNLNSPYRVYHDSEGKLGTIYASAKTAEYIYLGTNQGLFYRPIDSNDAFQMVPQTQGQVWVLRQFNDVLFCGHDMGTFQIDGKRATQITSEKGTWDIKPIAGCPNLLIQGNYKGLAILEKVSGNRWRWRNKIEGFDISSRYFEFVNTHQLLVSHEYKGVYDLVLGDDFKSVKSYTKDTIPKGIGSSLFSYQDNVYYAFREGLYKFSQDRFVKDSLLSTYFSDDNYVSGKLIYEPNETKLWAFFKNQIVFLQPGSMTDTPTVNAIDLPSNLRKSKSGFENILHLNDNSYLLGTTEGYLIIDLDKSQQKQYTIGIDNVEYSTLNSEKNTLNLAESIVLKNNQNNIYFSYSVPDFNSLYPSFYQYRLTGIYDNWSNWSETPSAFFENLPDGDYTFEVRAKVGNNVSANVASYSFSIDKPWYKSPLAIVGYVLFFIAIMLLVQYVNTRFYKKQKAKLLADKKREIEFKEIENKRQLVEFKNKNLQQDIENKNRELGLSTMNLIRKNEFLNTLKKELNHVKDISELPKVVKIIDKNINNKEDWKFFEEAFNNADKDFLKKIKSKHPSLTPNDLKLCAYLRLNLSSKEIAPLLNISHRSVEVKRYRLRKKMDLPHEASLTNYILEV